MLKLIFIVLFLVTFNCVSQKSRYSTNHTQNSEVQEVVNGFLKWYALNKSAIDNYVLVPASLDSDPNNLYVVEIVSLDKLIDKLESSSYLDKNYLTGLKEYVLRCDRDMRESKQKDGPPEGLDFDLILLTQEVTNAITKINKGVIFFDIFLNDNKATVEVKLDYRLCFELINKNDKWHITKIKLGDG